VVGDRAGIEGALVRLLRELDSISLEVGETDLVQMFLSGTRPAVLDIRISTGRPNELEVQRVGLLELGETMGLPVLVQPLSVLKRRKGLVCFDLDSTLVEEELIIEVARRAGRETEVEEITKKAMAGELEYRRSFIYRVALLRGVREDVIDEIWRGIHTPKEVVRLLQSLRMMGAKTAILSGAFSCFTDRARDRLGVDFAIGNEVEIRDGIFTGNVSGPIVDAQLKLEKMRDFAAELNLTLEDVVAVGDGANDIEIVREAGTGVAYNKGGIVKRYADAVLPDGHLEDLLHLIG
jgi:phosphoserine phosphatase